MEAMQIVETVLFNTFGNALNLELGFYLAAFVPLFIIQCLFMQFKNPFLMSLPLILSVVVMVLGIAAAFLPGDGMGQMIVAVFLFSIGVAAFFACLFAIIICGLIFWRK